MINKLIIDSAFSLALLGAVLNFILYFRTNTNINKNNNQLQKLARLSFILLSSLIVVASISLMVNILAHNFQMTYVWSYSSKELPFYLLLSSFFAGQEGSLLLWILFFIVIGFFLRQYTSKRNYEYITMAMFNLILATILLMLIVKSPFDMIWDTFPEEGLDASFMPENGKGMNPILENFWMIIHPPVLFIGYAAMVVPYILAISALFKKDFNNWVELAIPWTLVANAFLGLGIILGGVWAYETLGWGGFWGWDPVENSSLIPWIVTIALSHTLLVQKRTGALVKTNLFLGIFSFSLVLYAVFLTRSGVMSDTSVHSFGEVGGVYYSILLRFVIISVIFGLVMLVFRSGSINSTKNALSKLNRETLLTAGAIVILASCIIIFIGTSYPVLTKIISAPTATADISFYDKWNLPIAILILLLSGVAPLFKWKQESIDNTISFFNFYLPLIISAVFTILLFLLGVERLDLLFLAFAGFYAAISNILFLKNNISKNFLKTGSYFSHIGFALLMFGVIGSGAYSESHIVSFSQGETQSALGYELTYINKTRIEKDKKDREKYKYNIELKKGDSKSILSPVFYLSDFNRREQHFLQPDVKIMLDKDIYISPVNIQNALQTESVTLRKNEKAIVPVDSSISFEFLKFDMSGAMGESNPHSVSLGAVVVFHYDSGDVLDTLYTEFDVETLKSIPVWKDINPNGAKIAFSQLIRNPGEMAQSQALFIFSKDGNTSIEETEVLSIEVSIKPYINLVWLGSTLIAFGFFVAIFRYRK